MAAEIERFAGREQADGYLRLRQWLTRLYEVEFDGFIAANFDSPLSLLTPQLARLAAIGGFRRWDAMVRRFITDERLLRVFTFQALYAGVPPQRALAVYAVIAYMDTVAGVYFPRGGMRALPDALAAAAADAGVEFRYGADGFRLRAQRVRVTAVRTDSGERIPADAVVLTTELPDTYRLLGRTPRRLLPAAAGAVCGRGARRLPRGRPRRSRHHTILFGDAWEQTFRDIIDDGRVMGDPSLLVTRPTAGDPRLAPPGRDLLYVLAPAPNTAVGKVDWDDNGHGLHRRDAGRRHATGCPTSVTMPRCCTSSTPRTGPGRAWLAGTPFALAHTFAQTGPFRPANTVRGIDNAVLAGSSTVPGVGVPTALMSGRLAADRITGVVDSGTRPRAVLTMISSELDAAGVRDPPLRDAYRRCRAINARTAGPSSWPPGCSPRAAPAVHALYGFARRADDILDDFDRTSASTERAERLQALATELFTGWSNERRRRRPGAGGGGRTLRAATTSPGNCSTTSSTRCGWT